MEIVFLDADDLLYFHRQEMIHANKEGVLRDVAMLESCIEAPKASFDGTFLMDIHEMASSYLISICIHHPFTDGNKRVALLAGIIFLELNGYNFEEKYEYESAEIIIEFLRDSKDKKFIIEYIRSHTTKIDDHIH